MVTTLVLGVLLSVFVGALSLVPLPGVPDWLSTAGPVAQVFAGAQHLGAWFPVGLVSTVLLAVLAVNVVGFAVRLCRMAVSLFTGGGGSAA